MCETMHIAVNSVINWSFLCIIIIISLYKPERRSCSKLFTRTAFRRVPAPLHCYK